MKNKKIFIIALGAIGLLLLILFQSGVFSGKKIQPGKTENSLTQKKYSKKIIIKEKDVPEYYRAVGTIHSRTEVELASRITARIIDVKARSGDRVTKEEPLIELDKSDLQAQLSRSKEMLNESQASIKAADQAVEKAKAAFKLASSDLKRNQLLFSKNVVPQKVLDQSTSNYEQAQSSLMEAQQNKLRTLSTAQASQAAVKEAMARLQFATIKSPFDGIVAQQLADPGDLASPGITLMTVFDPTRIMFYVPISESLIKQVKIGEKIPVKIQALQKSIEGEIREIVPAIDPGSRTFLVKICIERSDKLMPGMFGVLDFKTGTKKVILIPDSAIIRIGQLEYVQVQKKDGSKTKKLIRSVKYDNTHAQVISGLKIGDTVLIP